MLRCESLTCRTVLKEEAESGKVKRRVEPEETASPDLACSGEEAPDKEMGRSDLAPAEWGGE